MSYSIAEFLLRVGLVSVAVVVSFFEFLLSLFCRVVVFKLARFATESTGCGVMCVLLSF